MEKININEKFNSDQQRTLRFIESFPISRPVNKKKTQQSYVITAFTVARRDRSNQKLLEKSYFLGQNSSKLFTRNHINATLKFNPLRLGDILQGDPIGC